jgi:hypothetical protein
MCVRQRQQEDPAAGGDGMATISHRATAAAGGRRSTRARSPPSRTTAARTARASMITYSTALTVPPPEVLIQRQLPQIAFATPRCELPALRLVQYGRGSRDHPRVHARPRPRARRVPSGRSSSGRPGNR